MLDLPGIEEFKLPDPLSWFLKLVQYATLTGIPVIQVEQGNESLLIAFEPASWSEPDCREWLFHPSKIAEPLNALKYALINLGPFGSAHFKASFPGDPFIAHWTGEGFHLEDNTERATFVKLEVSSPAGLRRWRHEHFNPEQVAKMASFTPTKIVESGKLVNDFSGGWLSARSKTASELVLEEEGGREPYALFSQGDGSLCLTLQRPREAMSRADKIVSSLPEGTATSYLLISAQYAILYEAGSDGSGTHRLVTAAEHESLLRIHYVHDGVIVSTARVEGSSVVKADLFISAEGEALSDCELKFCAQPKSERLDGLLRKSAELARRPAFFKADPVWPKRWSRLKICLPIFLFGVLTCLYWIQVGFQSSLLLGTGFISAILGAILCTWAVKKYDTPNEGFFYQLDSEYRSFPDKILSMTKTS